jgi:hypothetical protein
MEEGREEKISSKRYLSLMRYLYPTTLIPFAGSDVLCTISTSYFGVVVYFCEYFTWGVWLRYAMRHGMMLYAVRLRPEF